MNIKNFIIILILISLFGCASFSKREFRKQSVSLKNENLNEINGNFSFYPIKRFGKVFENKNSSSIEYANSYIGIINGNRSDRQKLDSILKSNSFYSINLKLTNSQKLHISLLENGTEIRDTIFDGKLKNGMFYIDNEFLECKGIPYLFGGCQNNKIRIGLSTNNNLIINEAASHEDALLLIFGTGYKYNATFEYQRINKNGK